jgi:hypothetical protein
LCQFEQLFEATLIEGESDEFREIH